LIHENTSGISSKHGLLNMRKLFAIAGISVFDANEILSKN